ncbi:hypothetical protein P3T20_004665 [Paraburkholderia sp. GAS206C]|uniref:hypothetical protein n=1 Tax=unclassified Paraburkholderia TaxID=2615204 RepID=UPI003D222000
MRETFRASRSDRLRFADPAIIDGERNEARIAEEVALRLLRLFAPILPKKFRVNPADAIAAKLLDAVIVAKMGCRWINSQEMN